MIDFLCRNKWSEWRESNPRNCLGKATHYHYATLAFFYDIPGCKCGKRRILGEMTWFVNACRCPSRKNPFFGNGGSSAPAAAAHLPSRRLDPYGDQAPNSSESCLQKGFFLRRVEAGFRKGTRRIVSFQKPPSLSFMIPIAIQCNILGI